ncbi:MAG TPA: kinase [Luteimonas sp.]|nr:kinase [Luteimonas sp.]
MPVTPPSADAGAPATTGYAPAFVADVLDDALSSGARVYGIVGLQGTGKSTLATQLAAAARRRGRDAVVVSIDDVYLDQPARLALARDVHPLLATRGPPGTHDVALACATVDALVAGRDTTLPRFDKIADRQLPRVDWPRVPGRAQGPALVILEGWFLSTPAEAATALLDPVNALERDEDAGGIWRRFCNDALARDYPPLWQRIDRLLFLQGPGFEVVPGWRWQQECTLQAANPGRTAMSRVQVERFVQFFERTSRQALRSLPAIAQRTIQLDAARTPR